MAPPSILPTAPSFTPPHTNTSHNPLSFQGHTQAISKTEILIQNSSQHTVHLYVHRKRQETSEQFPGLYFSIPVNEAFFSSGISPWTKPMPNGTCHLLLPVLVSLFFLFSILSDQNRSLKQNCLTCWFLSHKAWAQVLFSLMDYKVCKTFRRQRV